MKRNEIRDLVMISMLIAIIIVMTVVPGLGYIPINPTLNLTIIHIPVIIGAALFGKKHGMILGLAFGLSSIAIAYLRPASPFDLLFQNPLISVLPRFIFGLSIYYVFELSKKFIKSDDLSVGVAAFVSSMIHAGLVLGLLGVIYGAKITELLGSGATAFLWGLFTYNSLLEAFAAVIICIPVVNVLKKVMK